jgi:hypothetical protein
MANKIGKIIKTKNALHWDPYEPSQDKRHIQKKKNLIHNVQVLFYHW